ncbi:MAG: trigger factor [Candidatus Berkelbacteria bacterium]|nr:trigger factor [Candidatus Berkelbacteria bacterium]
MKTEKKQISKNRIKLTITIDPEQMERHFEEEYNRLAPSVSLPGFRPGKAPKVMTIEAIGQTRLSQSALERGVDEGYKAALMEYKTFPVTQPSVSISKHPSFSGSGDQNQLVFEVEFDILPEAKIGNYKKLKVDKIDPKNLEVNDEEVSKILDYLRRQSAEFTPIDRESKIGDWAEISFEGSIKHVVKEKLTSKNFPMVIGETKIIPGFEEKLLGMKKGENNEFEIKIPKDFTDKEFASQTVSFKLTLDDLKEMKLPELNNEFVAKFGLKNINELKANVRKSLVEEKKQQQKQVQVAQISEQLLKIISVDIPQSLIENEKARMKSAMQNDLSQRGTTIEKYLDNIKLTEDKLEEDLKQQSKRNILLGVAIGEIARKENIEMSGPKSSEKVFDFLIETNSR